MRPSKALVVVLLSLAAAVPGRAVAPAGEGGFFLVRFDDRITAADRARLEAAGLRVIDYEPHDAYVVWGAGERAAALPGVRSAQPVGIGRKLHAGVRAAGFVEVTVYGPALAAVAGRLDGVARAHLARPDGALATIALPATATTVERLARMREVLFVSPASPRGDVEDEGTAQVLTGGLDADRRPVPGYDAWLAARGLDGAGVRVAIVDTGISPLHQDLVGRVAATHTHGAPGAPFDVFGHGTHVAGIVGGAPPEATDRRDLRGLSYGQGIAPAVTFVNQMAVALGVPFPPPDGLQSLSAESWSEGARIWNASWHTGEGSRSGYTASTRTVDTMARDADFGAPGSEQFLMVFSAGNAGQSGPTVPHEAKNIIAVGSLNSGRLGVTGEFSQPAETIAGSSSRGPAADGRIFPTLAAPGGNVVSAHLEGALVAGPTPPAGQPFYVWLSGTSMAAPHGTGSAALVHQWWLRERGALPSPALVRAVLVNGAQDVGAADVPNVDEGWGRINLSNVFSTVPLVAEDQARVLRAPGESDARIVTVADASRPLRVTVAWSDAPGGVGASPALVNDLDLVVERLGPGDVPVQTWLGNAFAGGESVEGGSADRLNNLENVFLPAPAPGRYRVTVRAFNVPGDGIPWNADALDQDFALVVRNALPA